MEASTIRNSYRVHQGPKGWCLLRNKGAYSVPHLDPATTDRSYASREAAEKALGDAATLAYAGWLSAYVNAHERSQHLASLGYDPTYGYADRPSGWEYR